MTEPPEGAAGDVYSVFVVHGDLSDDTVSAICQIVREAVGDVRHFKSSSRLLDEVGRRKVQGLRACEMTDDAYRRAP